MKNSVVEVVAVSKSFGDTVAVKPTSLNIANGEFFSLLGPSGSGKTTLLRMIAGFETPTTGSVLIDGIDVSKVPPHKRPVNMVFQKYALFPHLSVFENIAFGLKAKNVVPKESIKAKVEQALALVRLETYGERYPSQLSGGQQQRIALARATVNEPKVLLLDEPLSALDPQIREEMQEELRSLQNKLGISFVMVTHDQSEALALSSRIAVFSSGRVEQVGSPTEVYEMPETVFVANFIGNSNLLSGHVREINNSIATIELAGNQLVEANCLARHRHLRAGAKATVCVKPHKIKIAQRGEISHPNLPSENCLDAVIGAEAFKGSSFEYILKLSNGINLRADTPSRLEARAGAACEARFFREDALLLEGEMAIDARIANLDSTQVETLLSAPTANTSS